MRFNRALAGLALLTSAMLAITSPLGAQMGMGRTPDISGIWHPVVGSGGVYEMTDRDGKKSQMEMSIVGKEDVAGKPGFWMEMTMASPRSGGEMYMKTLLAPGDGNGVTSTRMIMQQPPQQPMEMDMSMMSRGRGAGQSGPTDIRDRSERVGTETITVPAGTFVCEHYRAKDGSSDVWISEKVAPWGLVKSQGKDSSMVLTKVVTDAKDHITGTPMKMDMGQMMRGDAGRGQ